MPRQCSTSVLVIAIVNFVVAGLGLIYSLCVLALLTLELYWEQGRDGAAQADMRAYLETRLPGYTDIEFGYAWLPLLFAVLMVVAGIGLLTMQPWARRLSVAFALVIILQHISYVIFELVFVIPMEKQWWVETMWPSGGPPSSPADNWPWTTEALVFLVGPAVIFSAHALAYLIIMFRPAVSNAFAQRNGNRLDQGNIGYDPDDDEFDRRVRREKALPHHRVPSRRSIPISSNSAPVCGSFIYRGHSSARTTRPGDREPAPKKPANPYPLPAGRPGNAQLLFRSIVTASPNQDIPILCRSSANRHPLPRYKMCDARNIRQNAGVAGIVFSGKNGNGSRAAESKQRQKNLPPPPKKRLQIAAH